MKMVCPTCGLGGTADMGAFGRKVRCPGCRTIFRVTADIVVGWPDDNCRIIELSTTGTNPAEDPDGDGRRSADEDSIVLGLGTCSRCGFQLSGFFLRSIDGQSVCTACAA